VVVDVVGDVNGDVHATCDRTLSLAAVRDQENDTRRRPPLGGLSRSGVR